MSQISCERERIFDIIRGVKMPNIFMWLGFTKGSRALQKSEKIQFRFLETFELSSLWFINNLSQKDV